MRAAVGLVLRGPWSRSAWLGTAHVAAGCLVGSVSTPVIFTLSVTTMPLIPTVLPWLGMLSALLLCNRWFSACQQSRFATLLGVHIELPSPAPLPSRPAGDGSLRGIIDEMATPGTGRQLLYHILTGPFNAVCLVAIAACWAAGILLSTIVAYAWALPDVNAAGWRLHSPQVLAALTAAGLVALFAAPWLVRAVTALDTAAARGLLGPSRSQALAQRVELLTKSRAGVVDAADAERRRIERDLHDGVQQRLTSLAVNLGIARETLPNLPEPARRVIVHAHEQAKEALTELAGFVRGLHPAVLEDRGLEAAIPGIAARSPVPVRLDIDLPRRPGQPIEAAAYFVISEALTNVVKHADASAVEITARRQDRWLRVQVADDGRGGARIGAGSGLRGLARRVASLDGTLRIDSPPGGPTVIAVELPCE